MDLHDIGSRRGKSRRRVGRGEGSGCGKTCGRGTKGLKSRSGGKVRPGFEGGQMPFLQRLPKRGFNNRFRTVYEVVNVGQLASFEAGSEVTPDALKQHGLVKKRAKLIKILGDGDLSVALRVSAHAFSESARKKIEAAGGNTEVVA